MPIMQALQSVLTIFLIIGLGFFLTKIKILNPDVGSIFSKIVIKVSLPCFMIYNLLTTFSLESLISSSNMLFIPFISMLINFFLGFIISKFLNVDKNIRGTFYCMFSLSNTIFIGLPVSVSLFGNESIPYVLIYYIVNTLLFWSVGVYFIKKDGGHIEKTFSIKNVLKNLCTPPLIAFIVAIILISFKITPPKFVMDTCMYMGSLTTPLPLLFIGITLHELSLKDLKLDLTGLTVLIGRFIISPMVVALLMRNTYLPLLTQEVFIIIAAMPVMTQVAIICKVYDADYKFATSIGSLSTILSLIFIPIYMLLFSI
ncbi:AEC family transporter [Clostridium hydrogeniformans]|uniref:AEC family transporter n=1 Tax=Clostridium hydrogeniformans TaxID=349933 RepID=UPI000486FE90|nr:AEC family transporter [Clostridium hydrogeniformans]